MGIKGKYKARTHAPRQGIAWLVIGSALLFSIVYVRSIVRGFEGIELGWFAAGLLMFKTAVEICASFYGFAFLYSSIAYLCLRQPAAVPPKAPAPMPRMGIVYLCCNDLDCEALESLTRLDGGGKLTVVVHDDSQGSEAQAEVERAVNAIQKEGARCELMVLRRPVKEGGKAGAVNYVLQQTGHLYDYFLLCDNDSTALDAQTFQKALAHVEDERVAIVQCRTVGLNSRDCCPTNRLLSRCIDAFHVFMTMCSRFGWQPFVGHNALLRTRAVLEAGGFTPGFFSDDLDLTVRLNLRGWRVVYAPEILMGENHPPSYESFRKRTYKWAYGCVQTLKSHAWAVLTSRQFTPAEKFSFFQFAGFYAWQSLLLVYLMVTFLVAPFFLNAYQFTFTESLVAGSAIILIIYLPALSYFLKERALRAGLASMLAGGLVYGTADFACVRGVWDCLWNRKRRWIPTNQHLPSSRHTVYLTEALFGLFLLCVPLIYFPSLFYLPCAYLFAGKFLFTPALAVFYDDRRWQRTQVRSVPKAVLISASMVLLVLLPVCQGAETDGIDIRGSELYVNGKQFLVKGIHYSPWAAGTGPNKGYPYPSPESVERDFVLVRQLNANTILVYDPPGYVLDLAHKHNLKVLYTFAFNWWAIGSESFAAEKESILDRVRSYRDKPALLAWILGNEIPPDAIQQRGQPVIEKGLAELYRSIKEIDAKHPVTHSNWPPTKNLDLRFLDIISFNLYPVWPPEVVVMGYGNYINKVLRPIAGDKPLLITEFGVNSLEAGQDGQARLLKQSWDDIRQSGISGGVVFGLVDEWWKNYDNPVRPESWWTRAPAPDDEKTHDLDPEEYYGIMTADRQPKPAFAVVAEMFAPDAAPGSAKLPGLFIALLVVGAAGAWFVAYRSQSARPRAASSGETKRRLQTL